MQSQVPDAFQQKLSAEKTPTLCNTLPSFDAMVKIWRDQQNNWQEPFSDIIQDGINKLDAYHDCAMLVPAYTISMSKLIWSYFPFLLLLNIFSFKSIYEASIYST